MDWPLAIVDTSWTILALDPPLNPSDLGVAGFGHAWVPESLAPGARAALDLIAPWLLALTVVRRRLARLSVTP